MKDFELIETELDILMLDLIGVPDLLNSTYVSVKSDIFRLLREGRISHGDAMSMLIEFDKNRR